MPPARLLLLAVAAAFLVAFVQLGILRVAFHKLGLAPESAALLLMLTLFGSMLNLPLFTVPTDREAQEKRLRELPEKLLQRFRVIPGKTLIAVNVGGCIVPTTFCFYLIRHGQPDLVQVLAAVAAVAAVTLVSYGVSFSVPRVGIAMPVLVAPLAAAIAAVALDPEQAPVLAYIGGTLGVLIGADILRLKDIGKLGEPVASIGGAGSFDGIFITGIVAVLLT
ncbi:MAG: DUF1614 domain-containing protein [Burkholderiales bacterium]|nr:hypothetical protein [Rhodocyclaceae bacterium]MCZ2420312.1 DUF1614 domain-containing protein [Burkholderiales bacterium]